MNNVVKSGKLFFISLVAIVVISITLMTTYAFQTLSVSVKKGTEELKVKAGVLSVEYSATKRINISNMPLVNSYNLGDYIEFTIDNTKSTESVVYKVKLVDLEYSNSLVTKDFKYTLLRIDSNGNSEIISDGDFSALNGNEFLLNTNLDGNIYIEKGNIDKLRLYLWLENTNENQNYLENSNFKGLIEIESIFAKDALTKFFTKFNIYGNKDGNIFLGTLVDDKNDANYGKYKVNINDNNIYLDEPLRCIENTCDYIDLINKIVVRNIGKLVLNGTEKWKKYDNLNKYYIDDISFNNNMIISDIYKVDSSDTKNTIKIDSTSKLNIVSEYNSLDEFKNSLKSNNATVYYILDNKRTDIINNINLYNYLDKEIVVSDGNLSSSNIEIEYNK